MADVAQTPRTGTTLIHDCITSRGTAPLWGSPSPTATLFLVGNSYLRLPWPAVSHTNARGVDQGAAKRGLPRIDKKAVVIKFWPNQTA